MINTKELTLNDCLINANTTTENFTFFKLPTELITDELFSKLSSSAKILYSMLLNRIGLSIKNHWVDKNQNVFIKFSIDETMQIFNIKNSAAKSLHKELVNAHLITKVRKMGESSRIYVYDFYKVYQKLKGLSPIEKNEVAPETPIEPEHTLSPEFQCTKDKEGENTGDFSKKKESVVTSLPSVEIPTNIGQNIGFSSVEISNTNKNYIENEIYGELNQSINQKNNLSDREIDEPITEEFYNNIKQELKNQIDYAALLDDAKTPEYTYWTMEDMDIVNDMITFMTDALSTQESIKIGDATYSHHFIKTKLCNLNIFDMQHVVKSIKNNVTKIINVKNYYIKSLLTAKVSNRATTRAEIATDMYNYACGLV